VTEVRRGIADFKRRYGRDPEGFWLPETAVDDETLDVLAQEGIRFTILAPYQVQRRPPNGLPGGTRRSRGADCALHLSRPHGIAFGDRPIRPLGSILAAGRPPAGGAPVRP
jgi:alpha-amylase/alpha-mannosidase (GH57 family)